MTPPVIRKRRAGAGSASENLPWPALLSQALVAFTIEFDNEFERRMPHRTTVHGSTNGAPGPWLVSLAMWETRMRFVGEEGISVGQLESLARTKTNLNGMLRWGYVAHDAGRATGPPSQRLIHATPKGRKAREVWGPLFAEIEQRWRDRFGAPRVERLREALGALTGQFEIDLPDCLPILGYGLFSQVRKARRVMPTEAGDNRRLSLSALFSRALLAFAIAFERDSEWSLAVSANLIRVLDQTGVRVRDLPRRSGVSKEALRMAMGFLVKRGAAVVEPDAQVAGTKIARLTETGTKAQSAYFKRTAAIEAELQARFGESVLRAVRESLQALAGEASARPGPLFQGLAPYPDGWRAAVPKPAVLPHFPMVLHRGGFPDGS